MMLGTVSALFEAAVGLVSLVLTVLTYVAYRRTGLPSARFLILAFAVNAIKSALVAQALYTQDVENPVTELLDGAGDAAVVVLLVIPYFWRA